MFFTDHLFLLLIFMSCLIISSNQNALLPLTENHKLRFKRFLFGSFLKTRTDEQSDNVQDEDILLATKPRKNLSPSVSKKNLKQQDALEIKRILLKKENDYYGILNLSKFATLENINQAYQNLKLLLSVVNVKTPGVVEARQRLEKARDELSKQLPNQNNNQPVILVTLAPILSTSSESQNQAVINTNDQLFLFSTLSLLPAEKNQSETTKSGPTSAKWTYLILAFIALVIGTLGFVIYRKKRQQQQQQQSAQSNKRNSSKTQHTPPTYGSPESNAGDATSTYGDSEISYM